MSITRKKTSITLVAGAALTAGLVLSPSIVSADSSNPFVSAELSSGYMQLAEGNCGEGKCGANKKAEGKCGEGKCGADKKAAAAAEKKVEGKCGEGKCGADKKVEGKCGEGKCGAEKVDKTFMTHNPSYSKAMDK